jgi:RluA family pseudouridine synthase
LDRYVQAALGNVPPSLVQRLLRRGKVRLNGARGRPGDRIAAGDQVEIHHVSRQGDAPRTAASAHSSSAASSSRAAAATGIVLLHRDALFLVVQKPAGVACHDAGDARGSVLGWARDHLRDEIAAGQVRPALAHRIDVGTSGVVVLGLTAAAVASFHQHLAEGRVEKRYLAAVWGVPPVDEFEVDVRLQRVEGVGRRQPKVRPAQPPSGRSARTVVRVLARGRDASLVDAVPVTGRTHQIRAHLLAAGWPIVGDLRYGDAVRDGDHGVGALRRYPMLHAWRIAFPGPAGPVAVVAALPDDARTVLRRLALPEPGGGPGSKLTPP